MFELKYIYLVSSVLVLLVIFLSRHPVNFTSIFGLSTIIYGFPLYLGYTQFILRFDHTVPIYYKANLNWRIYAIFFMCQLTFLLAALLSRTRFRQNKVNSSWFYALIITLAIYMTLSIFALGDKLFSESKFERMPFIPIWYYFCSNLTVATFIFYVFYGKPSDRKYLLIPFAFVALDLALGNRTTFFLGTISVAVAAAIQKMKQFSLGEKLRIGIFGLFVTLTAMAYKPIYFTLVGGQTLSLNNLSQYVEGAVQGNEGFTIIGVLNEVVTAKINLPPEYFVRSLIQYFPFYETLTGRGRVSFNAYSQGKLFSEVPWGLASTAFGEVYTLADFLGVLLFCIFIFICLYLPPPKHPYWHILHFYIMPYIVFYFHRNDWHAFIGTIRLYFMASIGVFLVYLGIMFMRSALYHSHKAHISTYHP